MNDELIKKLTEAQTCVLQVIRLMRATSIIFDHQNDLTIRLNMVERDISRIILDVIGIKNEIQ